MSSRRCILAAFLAVLVLTPLIPHARVSAHLTSTTSAFRLPIALGLSVTVSQGNNDTQHDHVGKAAWAFDFIVGQTNFMVTAAQGGMVVGADDSSDIQCSDRDTEIAPEHKFLQDCWTHANYVLITDDDGTTAALYMHLLFHSLNVSSGMHVNQGDPLGLAGTTGWSTGVHLHFQVEDIPQQTQSAGWWWTQSRLVQFSNPEVLAQDACLSIASNGIPQTGQCFVVSNPPVQTLPPTPHPPTPVIPPTPVPTTQPPAPASIPGIQPFVGTWWVSQGAIVLTINADGSAIYQRNGGNPQTSKIQFTRVVGNILYGTVVGDTPIPAWPQGDAIPVGSTVTVTLLSPHELQVSNNLLLCPNTEQCAY